MKRNHTKISKSKRANKSNKSDYRIFRDEFKSEALVRRMTGPNGGIITGVGGTVAPGTISSLSVTSTTEWASYAARFTNYRVRKVKAQFIRLYNIVVTGVPTIQLYFCPFVGGAVPVLASTIWSNPRARVVSSLDNFTFEFTIPQKFLDSKLWTATNTNIAASEQFGMAYISSSTVGAVLTPYWLASSVFEVEFLNPL